MAHTIKHYSNILIDEKETTRYLGFGTKTPDTQTQKLILKAKDELVLDCRVCAMETPVSVSEDGNITFDGFSVASKSLAKNLLGCEKAVVFGATVGAMFDRLLQKAEITSPAYAVVLQAAGTAAIESLCDTFCEELGETRPRFSPGYGDLPLEAQTDIFKVLDLSKNIGVTLSSSLLMIPTKSVTAIVGLGCGSEKAKSGCSACDKINCAYRKGGRHGT